MDENPYKPPEAPPPTGDAKKPDLSDSRKQFNRSVGLGSIAMTVLLTALLVFGIVDYFNTRPRERDAMPLVIIAVAALACAGLGYSSRR